MVSNTTDESSNLSTCAIKIIYYLYRHHSCVPQHSYIFNSHNCFKLAIFEAYHLEIVFFIYKICTFNNKSVYCSHEKRNVIEFTVKKGGEYEKISHLYYYKKL